MEVINVFIVIIYVCIFVSVVVGLVLIFRQLSKKSTEHFSERGKGILSFTGGGLRALTVHTGVIHGISKRLRGQQYPSNLNEFLERYKVISSISGGSWFTSLMVYSPSFFKMLAEGDLSNEMDEDETCEGNPVVGSEKWLGGLCKLKGMKDCGVGKKQCCCVYGEKYNSGNLITKCNACVQLTDSNNSLVLSYEDYISRVLRTVNNQEKTPPFINKLIDYLPDIPGGGEEGYIKPFLYWYKKPWVTLVKELIFDSVRDIRDTSISSNPNSVGNHFVWSSVILQNAQLAGGINYSIGFDDNRTKCEDRASINDCGTSIPVTFDYDFTRRSSTQSIYGGKIPDVAPLFYYKDYDFEDVTRHAIFSENINKFLKNTTPSDTSIVGIAACSSAAGAMLTQTSVVEDIVDYKSKSKKNLAYRIAKGGLGLEKPLKELAMMITETFKEVSVTMNLSKRVSSTKTQLQIIESKLKVPDVIPESEITMKDGNLYVKMGDGGYFDNSSISNAIRTWQNDGGVGICKIVNINPPKNIKTFRDDEVNSKVAGAIYNLFGCTGSNPSNRKCENPPPKTWSKMFNVPWLLPHIFPVEDYAKERCLWYGSHTDCYDKSTLAEIAITYYKTITIDNEPIGIKKGTAVELYVLNVNTSKAEQMVIPGSTSISNGINYVNTAKVTSNLIQKIPRDLFNIIFLDEGNINDYTGVCDTKSAC